MNHPQDHGCRRCGGATYVLDEETGAARPCVCRAQAINRARTRRVLTSLPRLYLESGVALDRRPVIDLDPVLQSAIRGYARDLAANIDEGRGLWFSGPAGTGKTAAAVALARHASEMGHTVSFQPVPKLLSLIRTTFRDEALDDYTTLMERLESIDLLILDDVGVEQTSPWVIEQFYMLVNERVCEKRAVIVTTSLDETELERQVSSKVVSRLYAMCGQPLRFEGFDWRRRQAGLAVVSGPS